MNKNTKIQIKFDKINNNNELFMQSILDNSSYAIITTNPQGVITSFNKKAEEMLGYSACELIGIATPEIFHDKEEMKIVAEKLTKELGKTVLPTFDVFVAKTNAGLENEYEWTYITKEGFDIPINLSITTLRDKAGTITGYMGMVENIHVKKILEDVATQQKSELETILATSKDGIAILDLETNFLYCNNAYLIMTGFTQEELLTKSCASLSAPEDFLRTKQAIEDVMKYGFVENFEKTCIVKGGRRVIVNMAISLMPDKQRILISTKDITQAKKAQKEIRDYLKLIDENIITSSTDIHGTIISVSQAFCTISGYTKEELMGKNHRIVRHPDMKRAFFVNLWSTLLANQTWEGELKNKTKEGGYYWVYAKIQPVFNELGEKTGYMAIRQDITDKKKIEEISITDGLTGIFNRRHFSTMFQKLLDDAKSHHELFCFILMDIDYFKYYNDTYGHQKGDEVLIRVAQTLKTTVKKGQDCCFRLGGEEFGVIFTVQTKEQAIAYSHVLRQSIEELAIPHEKNSAALVVTASMGLIWVLPQESCDENTLYKKVDELLYVAKKNGRNQVVHELSNISNICYNN